MSRSQPMVGAARHSSREGKENSRNNQRRTTKTEVEEKGRVIERVARTVFHESIYFVQEGEESKPT